MLDLVAAVCLNSKCRHCSYRGFLLVQSLSSWFHHNQIYLNGFSVCLSSLHKTKHLKPGLHKPQLPVERSVTLVSSIVVERRRCVLQVGSVARLQENKET